MSKTLISLATLAVYAILSPCLYATSELTLKDISLSGMTLTVKATGQSFEIPAPSTKHHEMTGIIKPGQPSWRVGLRLSGPAWVYKCLTPGSLKITLQKDPNTALVEGTDYKVDYEWASICAVKESKFKPGTKLSFSYDYGMARLDLLVRNKDGKLEMIRGKEDKRYPMLPEAASGATPLLSVYLPANTTELAASNINFIDPQYTMQPPVRRLEYTKAAREKIASDEGLTIVFLGDSITAQKPRDFMDGKGSFVDRFASYLKSRVGDDKVIRTTRDQPKQRADGQYLVVQSGVGGNTTDDAVKRIDSDVLAHKPDLVIILFGANDENRRGKTNAVTPLKYRENLTQIVQRCRKENAEVIILTPPMKNEHWEATFGNMSDYARLADMVAESQGATLVDSYNVWENFPKIGYNYMIALGTCINHPLDMGHEIFFQGIKAVLEADK